MSLLDAYKSIDFINVSLEIRIDKKICDEAKIYYSELDALTIHINPLTATDEELAEMKGVSVESIKLWHEQLESCGWLMFKTYQEPVQTEFGKGSITKRKILVCFEPYEYEDPDTMNYIVMN